MAGSGGLSLGFGKDKQKSSNSTNNTLDPWSQGLFQPAFNQAQSLLQGEATPYTGHLGGTTNGAQTEALGLAHSNVGAGRNWLDMAGSAAGGAAGYTPSNLTAGQVAGADLSGYTNPWEDSVVQGALGDINRFRQGAISDQSGRFSKAGAWGGSRQGVADAQTNDAALRTAASTAAGLRQSGFQNAQTLAGQDIDRRFSADSQNQQAQLAAAGLRLNASGQLESIGNAQHDMGAADAGLLATLGQQQFGNETANNDAAYQEFLRQYQDPFLRSQALQGLLGTIPKIVDTKGTGKQTGMQFSAGYQGSTGGGQ